MIYTPLHVHSHYSLLDGLSKIDDLVAKAKECGMPALALTDHGVMHGVIELYQKCKKAGIKPIIGVEAYVVKDRHVKVASEEERHHMILLAENNEGYKNLIKLTTIAHLEGFYYKPRMDFEALKRHSQGIICLTACLQGELPRAIQKGYKEEQLLEIILKYQDVFGKDNYFLEIQHHPNIPEQKKVNDVLAELGKKYDIPLVATNDSHYVNTEDAEAHDILVCLQTKHKVTDTGRMSYLGENFSLYSCEQMSDIFRGNLEYLENTNKIAERCNVEIELGKTLLPHFDVPEGFTDFEYLKKMCYDSIERRYGFDYKKDQLDKEEQAVIDRLEYELGIIEKTGFASYFLIVQDFINWSKNNGIVVGPGRGSAAGSLVSYLINITNLDPIKYELLFERFLNPARISMPDIDTDFADNRRDEVLRYVESRYGKDHVGQIITFGTMAARAAVKDVGRVLDMPYTFCDQISKLIPMGEKLDDVIKSVSEVRQLYETNADAKRIIDFARKIEGVARHASTHACGVVITQKPMNEYCPTQYARDQEDAIITQYSLHPIEDLGLLKMDFLGLKNLTIIEKACEIIEKVRGEKVDIDKIPLDDKKSFKIFQDGKTTGVFQFESSGMKRYLRQLKPTILEDLIAMVALYRPGPMELIPDFIERKNGRQKVSYVHPKLESSLAKTFGIAIYQEQIMQIARDLAGFSLGEADVLRKAVGKKILALLAEQKEKFVKGSVDNGIEKEVAEKVFAFIEPFAGYGFNRSHAACYALIAYQTAYLKANYPEEFMASLLTSDQGNLDRVAIEIDEAKQMKIKVLQPDVNESFTTFAVVADSLKTGENIIRFGLSVIRNVGENIAKTIIHERKTNGPYISLENFLERINGRDLNKKSLEGLIKSGAMDKFGARNDLLENMDKLLLYAKDVDEAKNVRQANLFSLGNAEMAKPKIVLRVVPEAPMSQILSWEREFLGLYVSEHPYNYFRKKFAELINPMSEVKQMLGQQRSVRIAGVVTTSKKILTKKGDPMLFLTLDDGVNSVEVIIFPKLYKEKDGYWTEGNVLVLDGALSDKDEDVKILCDKVWLVTSENVNQIIQQLLQTAVYVENKRDAYKNFARNNNGGGGEDGEYSSKKKKEESEKPKVLGSVMIEYPVGASREFAEKIKMLFVGIPGKYQVVLKIADKLVQTNFLISLEKEDLNKIDALLGAGKVKKI